MDDTCPTCRVEGDGYLNVVERGHCDHFQVCDRCRVFWFAGLNLFSSWQDETPDVWERNQTLRDRYRDLTGLVPAAFRN